MAVIIKSNTVAKNHLGTSKMLGTTAEQEFALYKSKVLADGGKIQDEARTLNAFKKLFESGIYGSLAYFVAPFAGVKLDGSGGVVKAYSIDGGDMVGQVSGSGKLPKITGDSFDFSQNVDGATSGGALVLDNYPYVSKSNSFGFFINSGGYKTLEQLTVPEVPILAAYSEQGYATSDVNIPLLQLAQEKASTTTPYLVSKVLSYGGKSGVGETKNSPVPSLNLNVVFYYNRNNTKTSKIFRANTLITENENTVFERFMTKPVTHCIGKTVHKSGEKYGSIPVRYAGVLTGVLESKAKELSSFNF